MSFTRAHPLMRRLLALWLLVSLLGYGSLWAMDLHGGDAASHQSATHLADVTDAASTELPADQAVEPPCDHCCHGISHLLALSGNTLAVASATSRHGKYSRSCRYRGDGRRRSCVGSDQQRLPSPQPTVPILLVAGWPARGRRTGGSISGNTPQCWPHPDASRCL